MVVLHYTHVVHCISKYDTVQVVICNLHDKFCGTIFNQNILIRWWHILLNLWVDSKNFIGLSFFWNRIRRFWQVMIRYSLKFWTAWFFKSITDSLFYPLTMYDKSKWVCMLYWKMYNRHDSLHNLEYLYDITLEAMVEIRLNRKSWTL